MRNVVFKAMWLSVMVLAMVTVSSCSSDDMFGFYENDKTAIREMALSEEYQTYLEEYFVATNALKSIDTTAMVACDTIGGKILKKVSFDDFASVYTLYKRFQEKYPYYNSLSNNEKTDIMNAAILNSPKLQNLSGIKTAKICRTKSSSTETIAAQNLSISRGDASGYTLTAMTAYGAQYEACSRSSDDGKEYGGFIFYADGSGIFVASPSPSSSGMTFPTSIFGSGMPENLRPDCSFHIHPSGNLEPSNTDVNSFSYMASFGVTVHLILSPDGHGETYSY